MSTAHKFSLVTTCVAIALADDAGNEQTYQLREMTAAQRDVYLDGISSRMRLGPDGKSVGIKKFDGMQADLLSLCLFGPDGKLVPTAEIQKWPSSVVGQLFSLAQEINRLDGKSLSENSSKNG